MTFREYLRENNTFNESSASSDIQKSIDSLVAGAKKAFEIAILIFAKDVESGKITGNEAIDSAMKMVASEYKKHGVSDTDAKIFAKMGGAMALKDGGLDVPQAFLKQLHKEILGR